MPDYDLIIVGGGMVGASLALALNKTHWTIAIVDPRSDSNPSPGRSTPLTGADFSARVSALAPSSQAWLQAVAAWPLIPEQRLSPYHQMRVWDAEGSGDVHFRASDQDGAAPDRPMGHIVENAWVEHALWQRLHQSDRIETLNGLRVEHAERQNDNAWSLEIVGDDRPAHYLTCRQLVIADGARSPLRDLLEFDIRRWSSQQTAVVATVQHERSHDTTARQAFHRQGPLAFLPLSLADHSSIVWSLDHAEAEAFLSLDAEAQGRHLSAAMGNSLGQVTLCSELFSFPLHQMFARQFWRPGAVLIGDAAHQLHPLAGQGVNLGLQDASTLAEILLQASAHRIDVTEPLLYRRYARRRQGKTLSGIAAMEGFQRLFAPSSPSLHAARNIGMRAFNRSQALRRLAGRWASGHH